MAGEKILLFLFFLFWGGGGCCFKLFFPPGMFPRRGNLNASQH